MYLAQLSTLLKAIPAAMLCTAREIWQIPSHRANLPCGEIRLKVFAFSGGRAEIEAKMLFSRSFAVTLKAPPPPPLHPQRTGPSAPPL